MFAHIINERADGLSNSIVETSHYENTYDFSAYSSSRKYDKENVRRIQHNAHVPFHNIRFNPGDKVLLKMILMKILKIKRNIFNVIL